MSPEQPKPNPKGRGSHLRLANRFEAVRLELDFEQCDGDDELLAELSHCETEYFADRSQSVVTENDSPDIGFRFSLNPYRGCSHGCSYCYARPGHEYLGFNAGLDFETRIMVKLEAPALLREFLARPKWTAETIAMSGVTDCYQPAERQFRITRGCLEVALEARQPIGIITKNALVLRDLDLIARNGVDGVDPRVDQHHDAGCRAGPHDGAAHQHAGGPLAGGSRVVAPRACRCA